MSNEADWWYEDAQRHNAICAKLAPKGKTVEPPKLNKDGSLASTENEETHEAEE